jgi:hypothetical protein
LDSARLKDIDIRNVALASGLQPGDMVAGSGVAGLRLGPGADVQSLHVSNLMVDGFETGIIVEAARGQDLTFKNVTMRRVGTPWVLKDADLVHSDVRLGW